MLTVRPISAAETRPLRQKVLRPHQRVEELVYPGDNAPDTLHFGAFQGGELIGIASIYREAPGPAAVDPPHSESCWRLRGMAVAPGLQSAGIGSRILEACVDHIRSEEGALFWCNARVPARRFYERHGFVARGEAFELPGIGPHVFMERRLQA